MRKAIFTALAMAMAAPAFAQSDAAKDVKTVGKDASDSVQDTLHTDSGAHKAKRHMNRSARHVGDKARHKKNDLKNDLK